MNRSVFFILLITAFISSCVTLKDISLRVNTQDEIFQELADCGDVYSKWRVGEKNLIGNSKTLKEHKRVWDELKKGQNLDAFFWVLDVAEKGFKPAQVLISYLYEAGEAFPTRIDDPEWIKTASMQDSDLATYERILLENPDTSYFREDLIQQYMPNNRIDFARWLVKVENDIIKIRFGFVVGRMYEKGILVKRDYKKASQWYDKTLNYIIKRLADIGKEEFNVEEEVYWAYELYDRSKEGSKHIARWLLAKGGKGGSQFKYDLAESFYLGRGVPLNREQAYWWYFQAADEGNPDAMYVIGTAYDLAGDFESNIEEAIKWYQKSADLGNEYSMLALSNLIEKRDEGQSQELRNKAIEITFAKTKKREGYLKEEAVGDLFSLTRATDNNIKTAIDWYQKAVMKGSQTAAYKIGKFYEFGRGVAKNYSEAVSWYQISADRDLNPAQVKLAKIYLRGEENIPQNTEYAAKLLHDAVNSGSNEALVLLGRMYLNGVYVRPNPKWAEKWFLEGAARGNIESQIVLGINYFTGDGIEKNLKKSAYWLNVVENRAEGEAINILNEVSNLAVFDDDILARGKFFALLKLAIEQNNPKAQLLLGKLFDYGITLEFNNQKMAEDWYERAAWNGETEAFFVLGYRCFYGTEENKDNIKAVRYMAEAAKRGHINAKAYLAWFLLNGYGIEKNIERAVALYSQAEEAGNTIAKYHLGLINEKGLNGRVNMKQAIKYYLEASKDGHILARKDFCRTYNKAFVESADRFAEVWCKGN